MQRPHPLALIQREGSFSKQPGTTLVDARETQLWRETLFPAENTKACPKWSPDLTSHFPKGIQAHLP